MNSCETLATRVQSSFRQLTAAATDLNLASDRLGEIVAEVDSTLKPLKIGIASWVTFHLEESNGGGNKSSHEIGYVKINGQWGLAIRSILGDRLAPEQGSEEQWLFADAPRALRIRAVDKLPDLLDQLTRDVQASASEVHAKVENVWDLATAISDDTPIRARVRRWAEQKEIEITGNLRTSKYYRTEKSRSRRPAYWVEFPEKELDSCHHFDVFCERLEGVNDFHHLEVPASFLKQNLSSFHRSNGKIRVFLNAQDPDQFRDSHPTGQRVDFRSFVR